MNLRPYQRKTQVGRGFIAPIRFYRVGARIYRAHPFYTSTIAN